MEVNLNEEFMPGELDRECLLQLNNYLMGLPMSGEKLQKVHEIHGPDSVTAGPRGVKKKYVEISGDSASEE